MAKETSRRMVRWNLFIDGDILLHYVWIEIPNGLTGKEEFVYCQGYIDAVVGMNALPKGTWLKEANA